MDKNEIWDAVLARMAEKISRMEFGTWFKKVQIREISGAAVLLACPSEMNRNWIENKYSTIILNNFRAVCPEIEKIFFEVDLKLADQPENRKIFAPKKPARKLPGQPEVRIDAELDSRITQPKFTLENFIVGDESKMAHAACAAVARDDLAAPKKYSPLFIYGGVGLGKTHLLQATANEIRRRNPDAVVIYTTAERFFNEIVQNIQKRTSDKLRKKYRRVDALIIDDVQFFEGKEKTQDELFNTFNDLHEFNKQILFSADRPPSQLTGISDRLTSRMEWGLTVDLQLPNYETRLAIAHEKAKQLSIIVPAEILEFAAANCRRSLRQLENLLQKVAAEIEISEISPTVPSVSRIFRRLHPDENLENASSAHSALAKNADDVITAISDYFQVPATELLGDSRKKEIVFPRQISWLLCKEGLKMSFESIGHNFGNKNHTTIMHGVRKITALSRKDSALARHIHALKKDLGMG